MLAVAGKGKGEVRADGEKGTPMEWARAKNLHSCLSLMWTSEEERKVAWLSLFFSLAVRLSLSDKCSLLIVENLEMLAKQKEENGITQNLKHVVL